MTTETTFLQRGDITVTNARFIVGAQTFAMRGITSVQGVRTPASYGVSGLVMMIGAGVAAGGFLNSLVGLGITGVLVLAGGIWLATRQKPTFAVVLRTAGGEVTAYQSKDSSYISEIIQALNESIVSHG
jgi:hypothetical protein